MMENFPVFDLHCDTAFGIWRKNRKLFVNDGHADIVRDSGNLHCHRFYAFCPLAGPDVLLDVKDAELHFEQMLVSFCSELEANTDKVILCRTAEDLSAANAAGKQGAFLSLEGAEGIGCDPGRLPELKELGFSSVSLTWNYENALAGSHCAGGGLTAQGKEFVRRAQQLGILIDVSHLSDKAFYDICDITSAPIIATHSNSRSVCGHSRNLTDEQFKIICNLDGVVGLNLYSAFLNESGIADFSDIARHIDRFVSLGGKHHIALGADLDGCDSLPEGFFGSQSYSELGKYLSATEIGETLTLNIMNNNAVRFLLQYLSAGKN